MDVVDALDKTFTHAHGVIAGVRRDQHDMPTPCSEWTVTELLEHMVGVVAGLGAAAAGTQPTPFELGDDPAAQFAAAAQTAMSAWRSAGRPRQDRRRRARSDARPSAGRDQPPRHRDSHVGPRHGDRSAGRLPDDVAEAALEASRATISPEIRPGRFGPEVDAPSGASATDALVAFLGRTP